jgi:hypothetical protein
MNQRVVVIVLLALFTTCFVGSGAIATLTVIKGIANSSKDSRTTRVAPTPDPVPEEVDEPPQIDPVTRPQVSEPEPDEELLPPDEEEEVAEFAAPLIGTAEFAVFHVEKSKLDPFVALQKAAKGSPVKVFKFPAPATAIPPYVELRDVSVDDYAVIAGDTLKNGRGLSDAVKKALPKTKRVSVVDVVMPLGGVSLLEVSKVMAAFERATGGVLWDEEAQEYLSAEAWKLRRVDSWEKSVPHVSMNLTVFVDTLEDSVELRTAGMRHLGLPELELKHIPLEAKDNAVSLLNATAQTLAEKKGPAVPQAMEVSIPAIKHVAYRKYLDGLMLANADGAVDVELVPGDSKKHPTLEVTFTAGGTPEQRVQAALDALFGFEE